MFSSEFGKFLRALFLQNTSGRLLLYCLLLCITHKGKSTKLLLTRNLKLVLLEDVAQRCSLKKEFLEILQNSQETSKHFNWLNNVIWFKKWRWQLNFKSLTKLILILLAWKPRERRIRYILDETWFRGKKKYGLITYFYL